jgi:serpin B
MGTHSIWRFAFPILSAGLLFAADGPPPGSAAANGMNQFAINAYRELARGRGNLILSPYSISTALSMALEGARGQTAVEMRSVLHQLQGSAAAALDEQLRKDGNTGANQLLTAAGLWVQRGFPLLPAFQKTMRDQYSAPLRELDFAGSPEQARAEINSWTAEHTKDRIRDLFGPGSLDASNRLVLTSAIYFYGKWEAAFPAKATHPDTFRLGETGTVQTGFMHQSGAFGYAETPTAQLLEIKYGGTPMVFDVILPKSDAGIADFDKSVTPEELASWLTTLRSKTVDVALPKFRAESGFSLEQMLARMGMSLAFTNHADFSGIDGRQDLKISAVRHKAFVDVAEEGTEAAAATGVAVRMIAMAKTPERTVFRADHPFFFLIRDTRSGTILFTGRMMNPNS